jgi:hypothetical protein
MQQWEELQCGCVAQINRENFHVILSGAILDVESRFHREADLAKLHLDRDLPRTRHA